MGEGETGEGRGADIRRVDFHRSRCICAIKEITASDAGNCKGTCITSLYIVRGGSQEAQSKGNETQFMQGCEATS